MVDLAANSQCSLPTPFDGLRSPISVGTDDHSRETALQRAWDRFVDGTAGGDLVQTAAWARSKAALGFKAHLFWSVDHTGAIEGGGVLIARQFKMPGLGWPTFTVGYVARGPVIASNHPAVVSRVLDALEQAARQSSVDHLIVQPPFGRDDIQGQLYRRGYSDDAVNTAPSATIVIDLSPPLDLILGNLSASLRRNLKKSSSGGLGVRHGTKRDIAAFHELHCLSARRQSFTPLSFPYLLSQWDALAPIDAVHVFMAAMDAHPDRPVAGIWVTSFAGTVTYKLPGWSGEAARLVPSITCIWASIVWAKQSGFTRYDLGGLDPTTAALLQPGSGKAPDRSMQGPAAFKTRFGGELLRAPSGMQRTLHPVFRPVIAAAWSGIKNSPRLRRTLDRIRSG